MLQLSRRFKYLGLGDIATEKNTKTDIHKSSALSYDRRRSTDNSCAVSAKVLFYVGLTQPIVGL